MRTAHPWLPYSSCDIGCVRDTGGAAEPRLIRALRASVRAFSALMLVAAVPLLALPMPGRPGAQRVYCRLMLRCLGVRINLSGEPIRNLRGVLVVSGHISWVDIFVVGAVLPGSFVARAEMVDGSVIGLLARMMRVIPIERTSLRRLPNVVHIVAERLREGHTVVAFPEGTTWCGQAYGPFRPAMFQAAIDAARPVQPLRLAYFHRDGRPSTAPAFIGEESLRQSLRRLVTTRLTVAYVEVEALQHPGKHRRELARRCEQAVRGIPAARRNQHAAGSFRAAAVPLTAS